MSVFGGGHAGAAAGYPLQGTRCRVLLEGAAIRGVCALEQACWCRCEVQLQGAA